ncbi:MAG: hypothetical protein JWP11_1517 [Frankiales bacterium]|jgi:hypothetical protein|nr:hypothetical protein [Frankiales bacterium]
MNRRTRRLSLAVAALSALAIGSAIAGPPIPGAPATPKAYPSTSHAAAYRTFDAKGHVTKTAWHWTATGGNCCETYVSTLGNRLLEYGGSYPYYSDDHGKTWTQVDFLTPLYNGEGALVGGPGGDIFGIGWDPYTGDHLQGVRYTAASKKWEVAEAPIKTPFFDREWITYAKGPWTVDGATAPYITLVRGGTATKQVELISSDGMSYTTVTVPHDDITGDPVRMSIPVVKNPAADDWQPNPGTFTVPLNAGGLLLLNNSEDALGCPAARLNASTLKWQCVTLPWTPKGVVRQDSRGWLTQVVRASNDEIDLQTSPDGGRSWKSIVLTAPMGGKFEGGADFFDVKVNGKLGQAVIATRTDDKKSQGQDVVWRVDVSKAQPKLLATYAVGKGDISTIIGVAGATADRFDFPSVALFPDGRIAVSFDDSTTPKSKVRDTVPATNPTGHSPAVAILDAWRP